MSDRGQSDSVESRAELLKEAIAKHGDIPGRVEGETSIVDCGTHFWVVSVDESYAGGVRIDLYIDKQWRLSLNADSFATESEQVVSKAKSLHRSW